MMKSRFVCSDLMALGLMSLGLMISGSASAQSCVSTDQRDPVEQLDCFCNSKDRSTVQQMVDVLGPFAKKFRVDDQLDCPSAATMALMLSKNSDPAQAISKELGSLGYSDAQASVVLDSAKNRIDYVKNSGKQCAKETSGGYSLGPIKFFSYTKTSYEECSTHPEMSAAEKDAARMQYGLAAAWQMLGRNYFSDYFNKLNTAQDIVAHYPEAKISSVLKITSEPNTMLQLLNSSASEEKMQDCAGLRLQDAYLASCMQTQASHAQLLACRNLRLMDPETIQCLNKSETPEVIEGCGALRMQDQYTLACIDVGASPEKMNACHQLRMMDGETYTCLRSDADVAKIASCASVRGYDSDKLDCIAK